MRRGFMRLTLMSISIRVAPVKITITTRLAVMWRMAQLIKRKKKGKTRGTLRKKRRKRRK